MKRSLRPLPSLADYVTPKPVTSTDRDTWKRIGDWQRAGLVTVKPTAKDSATVTLTDKGRKSIAK